MYLRVPEIETPCFSGRPNADTYKDAIKFILNDRREDDFDSMTYIESMVLTDDN